MMQMVHASRPTQSEAGASGTPAAARWLAARNLTAGLFHAFQPVLQMRTGRIIGYEALLRGWDPQQFDSPLAVFETAFGRGILPEVETLLHRRAIDAFAEVPGAGTFKLFLNVGARLVGTTGLLTDTARAARARGIQMALEISERDTLAEGVCLEKTAAEYRRAGIGVALDDFGVGFAGLRMLYEARPDYVKIDRYFVDGIERDLRKRAIVSYLVGYAHALGITTIAEGIETAAEFHTCRDIGCDFAQGYLIGRPERLSETLPTASALVEALNREDRRQTPPARQRLSELLERLEPLRIDEPKAALLEYFGSLDAPPVVPVVDRNGVAQGVIRERDLKRFIYAPFGPDLLRNKTRSNTLEAVVVPCPICDIDTPLERVVESFSETPVSDGIIVVEGGEYVGFLSAHSLVRLMHERRIALATDQNPLTRLPGNNLIEAHIRSVLDDRERPHVLVYFDFDNFKPFNDSFGFRQGDRAILMFAERLRVAAVGLGGFAGHIGGDDFFLAASGMEEGLVLAQVAELLDRFRSDAESLYDAEARERGWFEARDRDGAQRRFPLLAVSAVVATIAPGAEDATMERIVRAIAGAKPEAKRSRAKIGLIRF
ncbi:GGDEF domain-containing protein [Arenibaculum pallidiluteum]|uniref:GGDEF domain-containing protein n=1 Tax=Arenibaculum pallidiluteum TaxID=2812559 RepID=UPI001A961E7C|nr:GGDEF domain-containing protein [Arenibaculum pallidiluteum]